MLVLNLTQPLGLSGPAPRKAAPRALPAACTPALCHGLLLSPRFACGLAFCAGPGPSPSPLQPVCSACALQAPAAPTHPVAAGTCA